VISPPTQLASHRPFLRCLWAAGTALSVALQVLVKMMRHQHTDLALQRSRKDWRGLGGLVQGVEQGREVDEGKL